MVRLLIILMFFLPLVVSAQKKIELKKKYFGTYSGNISSFQMDAGNDLVSVDSTTIKIEITEKEVLFTVGKNALKGTYYVMFEAKKYFLLDCRIEGQLAGERIVVYKKGNKISRDGLYPQPNAFLFKEK